MRLEQGADRERWLAVARDCEAATFFHTPYWSEVAEATGEWEDATVSTRLDDGAEVVYPLVRRRRRVSGLAAVTSTFAGCYGGPIATRPLSPAEAASLHDAVRRRVRGDLKLILNPFTAQDPIPEGFVVRSDFTQVLDLRQGFEAVLKRYTKGQRHAYKRGKREGAVTRTGPAARGIEAYAAMYGDNLRRWGGAASSSYPDAVFDALGRLEAEAPESVRLWMTSVGDRLGCGGWFFYWRRHVVIWHAASYDLSDQAVRPWTAFYTDVIEDAAGRGYEVFDFNPSGGHEGTVSFKRHLGAEELPLKRLRAGRRSGRAANRALDLGRRLVRR